jgi:hypothetical protein
VRNAEHLLGGDELAGIPEGYRRRQGEDVAEQHDDGDGQASLKAECTPPSIEIVAEGSIDAEFVATLEANLPAVFEVFAQSEVVANAMVQVVSDAGGIIGELDAQCAASFGGKLTAKVEAAVSASASVNVSVMASADVSGEASSG